MQLKRIYNHDAPKEDWTHRNETCSKCQGVGSVVNEARDGIELCDRCVKGVITREVPPVVGVDVLYAGATQHFSPRIVQKGSDEGWLERDENYITIFGANETVKYEILRDPGRYCCHCEMELMDEGSAKVHVEGVHPGETYPDLANPSGYERINYFDCVREE